jgi:hypothetical protein
LVRTKFEFGPLISRLWSGLLVCGVRTTGVCGPDYWCVGSGPMVIQVGSTGGMGWDFAKVEYSLRLDWLTNNLCSILYLLQQLLTSRSMKYARQDQRHTEDTPKRRLV